MWAHKVWTVAPSDPEFVDLIGAEFGRHNASGWLAGVQGGCDVQLAGAWVFGIQGDYDWTNAKGSFVDVLNTGDIDQTRIRSLASVTGRIGYAWGRFLGYVKGGGAWERDDYAMFYYTGKLAATARGETRGGWTVGVGGEYAFTDWLTGFVEYDYGFGTRANTFLFATGGGVFDVVNIKEYKNVVKAGLNLRFNWGKAPAPVVARY